MSEQLGKAKIPNFVPGDGYVRIPTDKEIMEGVDKQTGGPVTLPPGYEKTGQSAAPQIEAFNQAQAKKGLGPILPGIAASITLIDGLVDSIDNLTRKKPYKLKLVPYKNAMRAKGYDDEMLEAVDEVTLMADWELYITVYGPEKWEAQAAKVKEAMAK